MTPEESDQLLILERAVRNAFDYAQNFEIEMIDSVQHIYDEVRRLRKMQRVEPSPPGLVGNVEGETRCSLRKC